jgi:hypothetical protein
VTISGIVPAMHVKKGLHHHLGLKTCWVHSWYKSCLTTLLYDRFITMTLYPLSVFDSSVSCSSGSTFRHHFKKCGTASMWSHCCPFCPQSVSTHNSFVTRTGLLS